MSQNLLPKQFTDLEKYLVEWGLPNEEARFQKLHSTNMVDLKDFYDAMCNRIEEILDYLDQFNVNELFLEEKNFRKQLLIAFMFSLGFYLLGFYWIPHTLKEFGGLFFPINQLLGLLFSLVIIPQVYVYTIIQRKWKNPVLLSICYVILEEFIPQQFPAHIGHSFASLAPNFPLKLAPLFGAPVYSFLTALIALDKSV